MRVIAGTFRGRKLREPQGQEIRPTTDKVKESLFNIIQFDLPGSRVLDLFGGTGQLGLEALSRGAKHCTFVEQDRSAVALIRENIKLCGVQEQAKVIQGDALGFLASCREKYDIILLDPPYKSGLLEQSIEGITRFDILREHGIMVGESAAELPFPVLLPPYEVGREYRYGTIKLVVCHRSGVR